MMSPETVLFSEQVLACAVCLGGDDATTTAANFAIGFLGVIILSVLGGVLKFMHYLSRQQKLAASTPDSSNLTQNQ
jgi:hypothetical protein